MVLIDIDVDEEKKIMIKEREFDFFTRNLPHIELMIALSMPIVIALDFFGWHNKVFSIAYLFVIILSLLLIKPTLSIVLYNFQVKELKKRLSHEAFYIDKSVEIDTMNSL